MQGETDARRKGVRSPGVATIADPDVGVVLCRVVEQCGPQRNPA